ncbi:uncharacterized protein LOC128249853 [Octopus bimaculoides]|uniref:uncharacterized protein LOC128249853 n=1 Tax=Octopus bimaculoides TaxID=37653 RepID=UPI0022E93203|nr:uncharacterized protein LOC128249853 [Octopus bimaculoides]XP_052830354.1 uncharacterized protein LOC128249853 [Octopus bimaculoides]XP_052830355.1 uncharacterized protein LOC128249853 [Octopus bimaculoides]
MKFSICILLLIVDAAMSEICYKTGKKFCTSAMKKYPVRTPDTYYCNRIKKLKECFDGKYNDCTDYFTNIFQNKKCEEVIAKQSAPPSLRLESSCILFLVLMISVLM